jgi:hypothetical protein
MTGGQTALLLDSPSPSATPAPRYGEGATPASTPLKIVYASPDELEQHEKWLERLEREAESGCLWRRLETRES